MPIGILALIVYYNTRKSEAAKEVRNAARYERREDMEEMANAAEVIEKLAREAERLQLLELARSCKDLDEFIKKLEAMTVNK